MGEVGRCLPRPSTIGGYDPFYYTGDTYLLDVREAARDPEREATGSIGSSSRARTSRTTTARAQIWQLDKDGWAKSQKVALFGGDCGQVPTDESGQDLFECDQTTVEMIDFEAELPSWQLQQPLVQPSNAEQRRGPADGKVVIIGGSLGRGPGKLVSAATVRSRGRLGDALVATKVPRHDHSTVTLLADGSVLTLGGNASDLANDPERTAAGVPVAQIYKPSYFFGGERPAIDKAPEKLEYGHRFMIKISDEGAQEIGSVVLHRIGGHPQLGLGQPPREALVRAG